MADSEQKARGVAKHGAESGVDRNGAVSDTHQGITIRELHCSAKKEERSQHLQESEKTEFPAPRCDKSVCVWPV